VDYRRYPEPLQPLIQEWDRQWGLRTTRIDSLEQLAGTFGYATTVPLIAANKDIFVLIQRWLRDKAEQAQYLESPGEGKHGL
jgi:hypothetical protein